MRAGQVSAETGVTVKALRYYESQGLLRPQRLSNGYREYSAEDLRLVREIRALTDLGLTPRETEPFLMCLRQGHDLADDCPESIAAYQDKVARLDAAIATLTRTRDMLAEQMRVAARRGFRGPECETESPTPEENDMPLLKADPLPEGLPVPEDDGAALHLPGKRLPALTFTGTDGVPVRLDKVAGGRWVLFLYPLTGEPGVDVPQGWNEIPGARGCSQEACSFRDELAALQAQGVQQVLALSSDKATYQQDLVRRLHLPYPLLSDPGLALASALQLPTFQGAGMTLYKRLTMVVDGDEIRHVFYPIFPPDTHAQQVLDWVTAHRE